LATLTSKNEVVFGALHVRIWSNCIWSGDLSPLTIPTTTGKNDKYIDIIALGNNPETPTAFKTTIIIGAIASIGIVWLVITHGITDISIDLLNTIPTANIMPKAVPNAKPNNVADSVIHPCQIKDLFEVTFFKTVVL